MDIENNDRRHVVRKTVICQPPSYIGFSNVNTLVYKNNLSKRKVQSCTQETPSSRSTRSGVSPVKKYAKITLDEKLSDQSINGNINHRYVIEQKKKWRQKIKSDEDLKRNVIEKKKQSLQELQIKSQLLLKRNLKKKALKTKIISKNSPSTFRNKDNRLLSNKLSHKTTKNPLNKPQNKEIESPEIIPISGFHSTEPLSNMTKVSKINDSLSTQTSLSTKENISLMESKTDNSLLKYDKLKLAAIKIQSSYRGYRTRKHIKASNIKIKDGKQIRNGDISTSNKIKDDISKSDTNLASTNMSVEYPYNFIAAVKNKLSKALETSKSKIINKEKSEEKYSNKDVSSQSFNISSLDKLRKECIANPSFFTMYNKGLDSIYVMPTVQPFTNIARNNPFFSENNPLMRQFDTNVNNASCEFSVFKKASNLTSLSEPAYSKDTLQKSTVISELKSSLQEIQNLTVSITFNGQIEKFNNVPNEVSQVNNKTKDCEARNNKFETKLSIQNQTSNLDIFAHLDSKNSPSSTNCLNAPDLKLVLPRKNDVGKEVRPNDPGKNSSSFYHKQFTNELNLLDSFNESLRQVQMVEETLSTMRHLNISNLSQSTTQDSEISKNISHFDQQIGDDTKNVSSHEMSSEVLVPNNITDCRTNLHLNHKEQKITYGSLNISNKASALQNHCKASNNNDLDIKNFFEGARQVSGLSKTNEKKLGDDIKSALVDTIPNDSTTFYKSSFENHDKSIANFVEHISVKHHPLPEEINSKKDIVSVHDCSSDATFNSKKLIRDISLCDDLNLANHLNKFCVCLITQYIEDEKVRSEYLNALLKVREKTLLDATRLELLCLQMQKKQNHELVPLLKKKQRGLLLKSQQERNEIKHIKKFQQEQSQERKATLRRQLKHLKRMFSCEESFIDLKKKGSNLKNSTLILQSKSGSTQNSPVKGINISFTSETSTSNSTYCKLQESLEKKRIDLIKQKIKLNELLHMHYDVQLDAAEIQAMEHRLRYPYTSSSSQNLNVRSENKHNGILNNSCVIPNVQSANKLLVESKTSTKPHDSHGSISYKDKSIETVEINECETKKRTNFENMKNDLIRDSKCKMKVNVNLDQSHAHCNNSNTNFSEVFSEVSKAVNNFVLSGYSLNKLWEKITGDKSKKYDDKNDYHMSKHTLDFFFEEAKQLALQDLLKTLQCNTGDSKLCAKLDKPQVSENELVTDGDTHIPSQESPKPVSKCIFKTNDCNKYSDTLIESCPNINILNNLIQSNSRQTDPLELKTEIQGNKRNSTEDGSEDNSVNDEDTENETRSQDNIFSETFTIKENFSSDASDQSDTSKSTAHSLVEELTHLDITRLNEYCEVVEHQNYGDIFIYEDEIKSVPFSAEKESITPNESINSKLNNITALSVISQKLIGRNTNECHTDSLKIIYSSNTDNIDESDTNNINLGVENTESFTKSNDYKEKNDITIKQLNYFETVSKSDKEIDTSITLNSSKPSENSNTSELTNDSTAESTKNTESLAEAITDLYANQISQNQHESKEECVEHEHLDRSVDSLHRSLKSDGGSDTKFTTALEISTRNFVKKSYSEDKIDLHDISSVMKVKSGFNEILMRQETVSPSPDQSPRDSPTGEYSPAAVSLSICRIDEAEELRKKQLAIELEIKALEQQSQIPYCLVREIPDKPPPPYIPPSEDIKLNVVSSKTFSQKPNRRVIHTIESYCNWLWYKFSKGNSGTIKYQDFSQCEDISPLEMKNNVFIFDICHETFGKEFSETTIKNCQLWEYNPKKIHKSFNKKDVCFRVEKKVKENLGIEKATLKENLIINWAHKRQDHVNELLIKELYKEEIDWVNIEENEIDVKNQLTNSILESLILETCLEYQATYS